jgi:hypothetical protein
VRAWAAERHASLRDREIIIQRTSISFSTNKSSSRGKKRGWAERQQA